MRPYHRIAAGLILLILAGVLPAQAATEDGIADDAPQAAPSADQAAEKARPPETPLPVPPIHVLEATTELENGVHLLDADIAFALDSELIDALANGVALHIDIEAEVRRDRANVLERTVAQLTQRYRLEYHALSRLYLVTHPVTGIQTGFGTPGSAFHAIGTIRRLPLIDETLLVDKAPYTARLRARLALDALPFPLRIKGWFSEIWRPASEWYTWPLR